MVVEVASEAEEEAGEDLEVGGFDLDECERSQCCFDMSLARRWWIKRVYHFWHETQHIVFLSSGG